MNKAVIIGLGLIGGSIALELRKRCGYTLWGIDANPAHINKAIALGIIDNEVDYEAIKEADVVIISVPVHITPQVVAKALDYVGEQTLVFDVGSVKERICKHVENHSNRSHFVAGHPLAGTEFSGPESAVYDLFDGKVMVLCDTEKSHWKHLDKAIEISKKLNMRVKMMPAHDHDLHAAYVSHLSHVISFVLGQTVLDIERNEQQIFDMASTGFASTARLAKSSPSTWSPIFLENKKHVLRSLEEYIKNLQNFKQLIEKEDDENIRKTIKEINYIKKVLQK